MAHKVWDLLIMTDKANSRHWWQHINDTAIVRRRLYATRRQHRHSASVTSSNHRQSTF